MNGVIVEKEKMPEWAREVLLYEVEIITRFLKSLDKKEGVKNERKNI